MGQERTLHRRREGWLGLIPLQETVLLCLAALAVVLSEPRLAAAAVHRTMRTRAPAASACVHPHSLMILQVWAGCVSLGGKRQAAAGLAVTPAEWEGCS